jgi:hypothetical protein
MDGKEFLSQPRKNPQKKVKHLPKRASNARRKARCHECWLRGFDRKVKRIAAQNARERANNERRYGSRIGELTPWEAAKAARYAKRHPAG